MLKNLQRVLVYRKALTKQQAQHRRNLIQPQSIEYSFHVNLHKGKQYDGLMEMKFNLNKQSPFDNKNRDVKLDFQGNSINKLFLNGKQLGNQFYKKQQGRISLPASQLVKDQQNHVLVQYQTEYDNDGSGCVSFTDVDEKQYLYTQFEPYMANRVFPLFDQPDLKAKMKLAICFPEQWMTGISNQPIQNEYSTKQLFQDRKLFSIHSKFMRPKLPSKYEKMRETVLEQYYKTLSQQKGYKITTFKQTALLPSYLYCFVVGPYKKFICQNTYKNIPMSLYCIESLEPYLIKLRPYIEEMTNKSFQFFQGYFQHPYAFSKYDQVFAHQYKWGAMENTGIVTLNDLYLFKDKVSNEKMLSFGNTIVHELAHHWFGNLVTMRWWDDLWLNESFAQYISHFCLEKIKSQITTLDYQSAMLSFYIRKGWGYVEDQLITTHPITSEVANTHVAQSIFDGITYSKGAATMKQLMYLIGEDKFSNALGQYFNKYAFKNTELNDLLKSIEKYFPQIDQWKEIWLQKAGGNLLTCQWQKDSKEIKIKQSHVRPEHQTLRVHKINIAFIQKGGRIHKEEVMIKNVQQQTFKVPQSVHPQAIMLNYDDLTFCKIAIDSQSYKYFQNNLHEIQDPLLRAMIWRTLYQMVRDARMTSQQYLNFVIKNIQSETSDTILEQQLGYVNICISQYTPEKYREELFKKAYDFVKRSLVQIASTSVKSDKLNRITVLKDKVIGYAYGQEQKKQLVNWFYDKQPQLNNSLISSDALKLNTSDKWKVITKAFTATKSITRQQKQQMFNAQKQIDDSDTMTKKKLTCDVMLLQSQEQLHKTYQSLLKMQTITSTSNYMCTMTGFNSSIHKQAIRRVFAQKIYQDLKEMLESVEATQRINLKDDFKEEFMMWMNPIVDDTVEDLEYKISKFQGIRPRNDKHLVGLLKKIDQLKKRKLTYEFFQQTNQ